MESLLNPAAMESLLNPAAMESLLNVREFFKSLKGFILPSLVKPFPVIRADDDDEEEELVDPLFGLRTECSKKAEAVSLKAKWDECEKRVLSKKKTAETCEEELFDFIHFVDNCAAETLFTYLKKGRKRRKLAKRWNGTIKVENVYMDSKTWYCKYMPEHARSKVNKIQRNTFNNLRTGKLVFEL